MKKMLKQLMGALCVLLLASQAWAGAGAYSSTTVGPNVYSKNYIYTSTFYPVGSFPPGSVISGNGVSWSYSTSYRPAGFEAYLCWDSTLSDCLNITNYQSGYTTWWNNKNKSPNNRFVLVHRVVGSGTLSPPVYGNMDQIIVNYSYP